MKVKIDNIYSIDLEHSDMEYLKIDHPNEKYPISIRITGFKENEVIIYAEGDCCSFSWFEFPTNLDKIKGKNIVSIKMNPNHIDLPVSNVQEADSNYEVYIYFSDRTEFKFYLRNSSNGYYDGWIDIQYTRSIIPYLNEQP